MIDVVSLGYSLAVFIKHFGIIRLKKWELFENLRLDCTVKIRTFQVVILFNCIDLSETKLIVLNSAQGTKYTEQQQLQ